MSFFRYIYNLIKAFIAYLFYKKRCVTGILCVSGTASVVIPDIEITKDQCISIKFDDCIPPRPSCLPQIEDTITCKILDNGIINVSWSVLNTRRVVWKID